MEGCILDGLLRSQFLRLAEATRLRPLNQQCRRFRLQSLHQHLLARHGYLLQAPLMEVIRTPALVVDPVQQIL
jgi:hypothetical protein